MTTLINCLRTGAFALLLASCVKIPRACFIADNLPASGIAPVGTTINFDAGCSVLATDYRWSVHKDSAGYINNEELYSGEALGYTFRQKGNMRVNLTVVRKNKKGNSKAQLTTVK